MFLKKNRKHNKTATTNKIKCSNKEYVSKAFEMSLTKTEVAFL